jgi:hypothetical protein
VGDVSDAEGELLAVLGEVIMAVVVVDVVVAAVGLMFMEKMVLMERPLLRIRTAWQERCLP